MHCIFLNYSPQDDNKYRRSILCQKLATLEIIWYTPLRLYLPQTFLKKVKDKGPNGQKLEDKGAKLYIGWKIFRQKLEDKGPNGQKVEHKGLEGKGVGGVYCF